jgi:xylulokinase
VDEACEAVIRIVSRVQPDPAAVHHMTARYEEYRKLYPAMKGIGWE